MYTNKLNRVLKLNRNMFMVSNRLFPTVILQFQILEHVRLDIKTMIKPVLAH